MKKILILCAVLLLAVTASAQNGARYFGIKSGKYVTEMDMLGEKLTSTVYFDDYGAKQFSKRKVNMMGSSTEIATLKIDDKSYMINYEGRTVQEMPSSEGINYLNLTPEIVKKYNIREVGRETVNGRECIKYTLETSQMGQTVKHTTWIWKGLPMKTVLDLGGGPAMSQTTKEITEGPVDASLFVVPKF